MRVCGRYSVLSAQLNTCKCFINIMGFQKDCMDRCAYAFCVLLCLPIFSKALLFVCKVPIHSKDMFFFQALGKHACSNETDNTTKQEPCCMQLTELSKIKNAIFVPLSFIYESLMIYFCKNNGEQLDDFYRFK